jgi:hypothetical protein
MMYDPYHWYWMTTYSSVDARRATGRADLLFMVFLPGAMVVGCIALAIWVHLVAREPKRSAASKRARVERRRLAQMERQLLADDPALARMLSDMRLPPPTAHPSVTSPRRQEHDR